MRRSIASIALLGAVGCVGCKDPPAPAPTASPTESASASSTAAPRASATPKVTASSSAAGAASSGSPRAPLSASASSRAADRGPALTLDPKTHDLATGAYVAIAGDLAVIRRKDGELATVRLGDKPTALADDGVAFARTRTAVVERGAGAVAYYIDAGKLVRRAIDDAGKAGPPEVLTDDAEEYAPHAARVEGAGEAAAYVARRTTKDGERRARLWVDGKGTLELSPAGSGAATVFLVPVGPSHVSAVWMDQRSALAPIHAAWIDLTAAPRIEREGVAWIGPPSELSSIVTAVRVGDAVVALSALPKDGSVFGLASVPITSVDRPRDDAVWLDYPNGLDPAPVVPLVVCGRPMVALVRPTAAPVDSPKVVALATVDASGLVTERVELGRAARVDHVAAWGTSDHGWVGWAGDGRTRVRRVKCGK